MEEEQLNPRLRRKVLHAANLTIARLSLAKDAVVPEHSHVHEQVCLVESGIVRFTVGGRAQVVRAGEAIVVPSGVPHFVEVIEDATVTDIFSPARDDWQRGDDAYLRR
jgi:quercetin dioxygenase-like cupin family protein